MSDEQIDLMRMNAEVVARLLELGDDRLLADDGPVGGQLPRLSPDEWGKVYRACQRIVRVARGIQPLQAAAAAVVGGVPAPAVKAGAERQ